ncbi:Uncharacterised protein [Mycobacteroides abscessus subsp. abscessus]|nr:Uncharacterised protein [Mycobacteroides abscessus subsp. abscessus]
MDCTCPSVWIRATRSPRSYGITTSTGTSPRGTASAIASRSVAIPSPVCADTNSALGNARRSCASARSPAASTLLITNSSGAADAS